MFAVAELHRSARKGGTLLAPNLRAARQLRRQLAAYAADSGLSDEVGDSVLHWRAWTAQLWQKVLLDGRDERVLLQPLQERFLWEQVLAQDPGVERTDALLDLCLSAETLLYRSCADAAFLLERGAGGSADTDRFLHWFRAFAQRCRYDLLLPAPALEAALIPHRNILGRGELVLCGLADLDPAQKALLTAAAQYGASVRDAPQEVSVARTPTLLCCRGGEDELQVLARHLAGCLQAAKRPDVAVVVPDLSSSRDRIDRVLREHIPESAGSGFAGSRQPLWEFSTGRPLASAGVVADALHLLTWTVRDLQPGELSLVLRSPHFDWPVNREAAASLDAALLRRHPHLRAEWSPRNAANLVQRSSRALADALHQRTRSWAGLHGAHGSFTHFAERARHILRDFGWFRSGDRTTAEFQAVTRFEHLLDGLSGLDLVGGDPPAWSAFIQRLTAAARDTSFARENTGAPIQFLTPDESTGVEAAESWVLHADEDHWSSRAATHPLLPQQFQARHGMPGTDPVLDGTRLRERVERIATIAPGTTFSYAGTSDAGEQRPSAAVLALPSLERRDAEAGGAVALLHASAQLETFQDGDLVPLRTAESPIPGGVSTLQSQAACAFRAFAERRLGSAALQVPDLGLDARDRGNVLHRALQLFWNEYKDRATLRRLMAEERLDDAIHRTVEQASARPFDHDDHWSNAYLEVQRTNLRRLLRRWLLLESERPDFRVLSTEAERTVTVGPISMAVRIDRIDEVTAPDGSRARVILDYKTGSHTAKKWEGDRPDEPQLPLYATSLMAEAITGEATAASQAEPAASPIGAIAFAVVRAGDKLSFVSAPGSTAWLNSGEKASMATLEPELDAWHNTLDTLAYEFAAGNARVGPKEYPATCRFCDQRLLCRLNPALLDAEDDPELEA